MLTIPRQVVEVFDDIGNQINFWEMLYLNVLEQHAPKRKFQIHAKSLPWIDDETRELMRHRDWWHKKAIKENSIISWDMYKKARNKTTSALRKAKTNYYLHVWSSNIHPSELCNYLNSLLSQKKSLVVNNQELSDKSEIAEAVNAHFIHAAPQGARSSASTNPVQETMRVPKPHNLSPVTQDEVSTTIMALDPKMSSGPSDIKAKCLQFTLPSISSSITRILNLSLLTGSVPSSWKAANVTPVFKKGDKLKTKHI